MNHHGQHPSEQAPKQGKEKSDEGKDTDAKPKQNNDSDSDHHDDSRRASGSG